MSDAINRRDFIKRATLTGAGTTLAMAGLSTSKVLGANEKIIVGAIGTGRIGVANLTHFLKQPDVEVAAVCDVYQPNLEKGLKATEGKAKTYKDFREILDRQDIDAVLISTPDHWHPLQMVLGCQAGKDVYVEKPISVTIEEGQHMVEAARKSKRVVQVGTVLRSSLHYQKAVRLIQQGFIGHVSFVRVWSTTNAYPEGIGNPPDCDPPPGLDWDLWLGPAPKVPFNPNRFGVRDGWSTFRYFWDYAGGHLTDLGVHRLDIVQWAMKVEGPSAITAGGGKFGLQDNSETPDTLQVSYEYPGWVCGYESRWLNESPWKSPGDTEFCGTEGTLVLGSHGFQVYPEKRKFKDKEVGRTAAVQMEATNDMLFDHVRNFLDCVKTRQQPIADIDSIHRATSTCHLGNVAYRSKERLVWDVANQRLAQGGAEARKLLAREYRPPWKLVV